MKKQRYVKFLFHVCLDLQISGNLANIAAGLALDEIENGFQCIVLRAFLPLLFACEWLLS